jgi:putrescine aminotransferase
VSAASHPSVVKYARHVNPAFVKLLGVFGYGRLFERAEGVWVYDHEGRRYLDFLAAYGCMNLGHNHPRLVARLKGFLDEQPLAFCHVGPAPHAGELAAALAERLAPPLEVALFGSTGAEAVEAALKLARAATGRAGFAYCAGGYHGTSFGTLSVMGAPRMRSPFEPLLPGCVEVPFGDLGALRKALASKKLAAFVVEPIQGEGGVVLPPRGYLAEAQALCTKHGTLLVLDEIQTGLGRCGTRFAYEAEGFVPDVIVLAKALSGGLLPISAAVVSQALHHRAYGAMDRFDLHASTFAGNALSCVAALETLAILDDEGLAAKSAARGEQLLRGLKERLAGHPMVKEVRGRGLLVAIELGPTGSGWMNRLAPSLVSTVSERVFGQWAAFRLLERGILCQPASHRWDVLKLEPPLTIDAAQIDQMLDAVGDLFSEYQGVAKVLYDAAACVQSQARQGWTF